MTDILIRGMEMPNDASLWLLIRQDGTVFKIKDNDNLAIPKKGTAVPLQAGHGRLIDADALLSVLDILRDKCCDSPVWDQMQNIVENMVTIVPAEGGKEHD